MSVFFAVIAIFFEGVSRDASVAPLSGGAEVPSSDQTPDVMLGAPEFPRRPANCDSFAHRLGLDFRLCFVESRVDLPCKQDADFCRIAHPSNANGCFLRDRHNVLFDNLQTTADLSFLFSCS